AEGGNFLTGRDVRDAHASGPVRGRDPAPVRAHRDRLDDVAGCGDLLPGLSGRDVPDLKVPVVARGDQPRAVRAEGQGPYLAGLGEGRAGLPGSRVPQAHRAVPAPRGDPLAVGAIGQWVDVTLVAAEQRRAQPGPHFPDPRGPVRGSRRQAPAVLAEFELEYLLGVAV